VEETVSCGEGKIHTLTVSSVKASLIHTLTLIFIPTPQTETASLKRIISKQEERKPERVQSVKDECFLWAHGF